MGSALYEKGVIGHVTIDLVSFPNVEDPTGHPFFWAVDINLELSDNAAVCCFFDILMEGKLDPQTGEYEITWDKDREDPNQIDSGSDSDNGEELKPKKVKPVKEGTVAKPKLLNEPRGFMFCSFLHHPGLAKIQYKTFFHMCRL